MVAPHELTHMSAAGARGAGGGTDARRRGGGGDPLASRPRGDASGATLVVPDRSLGAAAAAAGDASAATAASAGPRRRANPLDRDPRIGTCGDCGAGPKAYGAADPTSGAFYCATCWEAYGGMPPPPVPAPVGEAPADASSTLRSGVTGAGGWGTATPAGVGRAAAPRATEATPALVAADVGGTTAKRTKIVARKRGASATGASTPASFVDASAVDASVATAATTAAGAVGAVATAGKLKKKVVKKRCRQCDAMAVGRADPDGVFYCNACWAAFDA